jgi:hypothetical protein
LTIVRMQRVHIILRTVWPFSNTEIFCKLGLNLRLVDFRDQGRFFPNVVVLPQTAHFAMAKSFILGIDYPVQL